MVKNIESKFSDNPKDRKQFSFPNEESYLEDERIRKPKGKKIRKMRTRYDR